MTDKDHQHTHKVDIHCIVCVQNHIKEKEEYKRLCKMLIKFVERARKWSCCLCNDHCMSCDAKDALDEAKKIMGEEINDKP